MLRKFWITSALMIGLLLLVSQVRSAPTAPPMLGGCPVLPADNVWNVPIDKLPVDSHSSAYINTIGAADNVHADFGSGIWPDPGGGPIGIPYIVVPQTQPLVNLNWTESGDESDPGPYPVPTAAPIEGGPDSDGDRHVLIVRQGECKLYELYDAFPQSNGSWNADSGAVYTLTLNGPLRPAGWTSADAAGLPILPGLVRYDEVAAGEINHAIRFTVPETRHAYVWPARHHASDLTGSQYPPMGQRFRLKASFAIDNRFSEPTKVILRAMKKYGLILADNGSSWYISGAPDERWDNDMLHELDVVVGSDFEAVDVSSLMVDPNSGQAIQDFALQANPTSRAIDPGGTATYQLAFTPSAAFANSVTATTTSPSPSLTLQLSAINFTLPRTVTLTVLDTHPVGTSAAWYSIPITATSGSVIRTVTVSVLVGGMQTYLPTLLKK
ncbi:hypothetical protein TFLX_02061 [Thermoflexales bacterium]|nr:hypothetical protein TFLX_02061 [Thermoflexales bacterium]